MRYGWKYTYIIPHMKIPKKNFIDHGILYTYTYASSLPHLPPYIFPLKGKDGLGITNQWKLIATNPEVHEQVGCVSRNMLKFHPKHYCACMYLYVCVQVCTSCMLSTFF